MKSHKSAAKSNSKKVSTSSSLTSSNNSATDGNQFGCEELTRFLKSNELSYLLRSQTVLDYGYQINYDHQCLTVFSCTNFKNTNNEAAVALIDCVDYVIRFVRFEAVVSEAPQKVPSVHSSQPTTSQSSQVSASTSPTFKSSY